MRKIASLIALMALVTTFALAETPSFQSRQIGPQEDRISVKVYTDQSEYKVGEEMDISLKANDDCYFILYYVDSKGNAQIIAPSSFSKKNKLRKNQLFKIRDNSGRKLEQKGPGGYEKLQVVATRKPLDLFDFGRSINPNTGEVYDPGKFVQDVNRALAGRVEQSRGVGQKEDSAHGVFGLAEITYTVR